MGSGYDTFGSNVGRNAPPQPRALSAIEDLREDADIADLQRVFGGLDQVEQAEYDRIAQGRLEVIERFSDLAPEQKERVIQEFLFDHLWLLHPPWERPTANVWKLGEQMDKYRLALPCESARLL